MPVTYGDIYNDLAIPVKTYTDRGDSASEALIRETVGWTGKNFLDITGDASITNHDITFTKNSDNTITIDGTNDGTFSQYLANSLFTLPVGTYTIIGLGTNVGVSFALKKMNGKTQGGSLVNINASKKSATFSVDYNGYDGLRLLVLVDANTVVDNDVVKPMICDARIKDSTYEPYHESVEECKLDRAEQRVLGAKNLLENKATSETKQGVTFTVNADKSVTVNGTTTTNAALFYLNSLFSLEGGKRYILSDGLSEHNTNRFLRIGNASDGYLVGTGTGDNVAFTATATMTARISVEANTTVNNLTFKPMIRLASDPDDTYVPYAMTNKKLTDVAKGIGIIRTLTSSDDLDDLRNDLSGLYYVTTSAANSPEGINYYMLLNAVPSSNSDAKQVAFNATGTGCGIYVRSMGLNATWTNWYKFSGTKLT